LGLRLLEELARALNSIFTSLGLVLVWTEGVGKGEGVERRVVFAGILPTHLSKVTSARYRRPLIGVVITPTQNKSSFLVYSHTPFWWCFKIASNLSHSPVIVFTPKNYRSVTCVSSVFITRIFFESQSYKIGGETCGCAQWCQYTVLGKPSEQDSVRSYFRNLSFLACSTLTPSMNNLARRRSFGAFSLDAAIYPDANDAKRGSPSRGRGK